MGYQDMTSKKAFESTKSRIMRRRSLYRSLARRGLVHSDPSLKNIEGSVYASIRRFLEESGASDPSAQEAMNNWYEICINIYEDPGLEQPPTWGKFLSSYKRNLDRVNESGDNSAVYQIVDLLQDALIEFPMELMAVDESSMDDQSDILDEDI